MKTPIRILHLEDSPRDAELIRDKLEADGLIVDVQWADTREKFETALAGGVAFDLILCDYNLPGFDGGSALVRAREQQPAVPVIMISGSLNEEQAVQCLHRGATDYLLKQQLERLPSAVRRALQEAKAQRRRLLADVALRESEARFRSMADSAPVLIWMSGVDKFCTYFNQPWLNFTGRTLEQELGNGWAEGIHPDDLARCVDVYTKAFDARRPFKMDYRQRHGDGVYRWLSGQGIPRNAPQGGFQGYIGTCIDITERKCAEQLVQWEKSAMELIVSAAPLPAVLDGLMLGLEKQMSGALCSVLLLDADGAHLRHGAAPSLPPAYCRLIDGVAIGPAAGSCGTAAYTNRQVIVTDIGTDPLWADYRALAAEHGLRACWSTPFHSGGEKIIGTFAVYYREPRSPAPAELELIERAKRIVSIAVERKQAAEALRGSQDRLTAIINSVDGIVWEADAATFRFTFVSPRAERLLGYPSGRWIDDPTFWADHIHPDDREQAVRYCVECTEQGRNHEFEYRMLTADDRTIWLRDIVTVAVEPGRPIMLRGIMVDITERKRAEQQIREQAEILEFASEAIIITGLDHRATFWNRGAERLYGRSAAEALGRTAKQLFDETVFARMVAARNEIRRHGEWKGEITQHDKAGRPVFVEIRAYLVRNDAGQPRAFLYLVSDITENKKLTEQLQHAQRLESLGMLAAGIAHDFNNALAPIIMCGPLLRSHVSDPRCHHYLDLIEKSAERSVALVRQLLSFARGASGESLLLQIRHVLREVLELAEATFPKSIRVESHLPGDLRPVQGNATQLHQIFLNLCVNARDAMPSGGELTLTAANRTLDSATAAEIPDARPGAYVTVEVRDTGTGIPPEVLTQIWEPFYTTKGEGKGTGLGLSTVRGILQTCGGFATVQTHAGRGTTFTVYLPAAAEHRADGGTAHPYLIPSAQGEGELILVVDDEEPVRLIAAEILRRHGYQVITAGDGAEAIAVFAPRAADVRLLLTDLQMPMLGGAALATALRRLQPGLPVVAMSGANSRGSAPHQEFMAAFLAKPFKVETLLAIVRQTLDEAPPPAVSPSG